MQRRLQIIILSHIWALVPVALLWFLRPAWRGPYAPTEVRGLFALGLLSSAYLIVRTVLTLRGRLSSAPLWPYADVALVSGALAILRSPTDPLSAMYFIPLASAVASLDVRDLGAVAGIAVGSYLGVIIYSGVPWTIGLAYRLIIILVIASLYGWVLRLVAVFERAAERAEYQAALAREIHDGIQHYLVTMGARLDLAGRLVRESPARTEEILAAERDALRRASDELRYLVRRLRSASEGDLATALRRQLAGLAERWPFTLNTVVPETLPRLAPAAEHALLRVLQEALTNVAKHADARAVEVRVESTDGMVRCSIRDDGRGFDATASSNGGLAGLRERVRAAGGSFEVASIPGTGSTVTATFPVAGSAR